MNRSPSLTLRSPLWAAAAVLTVAPLSAGALAAEDPKPAPAPAPQTAEPARTDAGKTEPKKEEPKKEEPKPFAEVVKDTEKIKGLYTFYRTKKNDLWLEVTPEMLAKPYFLEITAATGLGGREGAATTGDPLFDIVYHLKRVREQVFLTVGQTNFRARDGDPAARSLSRSFGDSVLAAFKVESRPHPERKSVLVNATSFFYTDLPALTQELTKRLKTPFALDKDKSYIDVVKSFPENSEVEVQCAYAAAKAAQSNTLADGRSAPVRLRYSFLELKPDGYTPRVYDPRVGYFDTAFRDLTDDDPKELYTRYINRWNLEKQDPSAALSAPKKPIVFWIDDGVPVKYRKPVADGILLWNRAFEKIGFKDAIQVKQVPDGAEIDPFDVRYNVLRWATSNDDGYAVALARVNPLTGEVINAAIRMDASIVGLTSRAFRLEEELKAQPGIAPIPDPARARMCEYGKPAAREAAFGASALDLLSQSAEGMTPAQRDEYVRQYIVEVVAHEMGHILGLRHNFKASTMLGLQDLNDTVKTRRLGLVGSVMDYNPANIAPPGTKQGDYYTTTLGPYDLWAIEYGYTPSPADAEKAALEKIASRSTEPGHQFATDEDVADFGFAPFAADPYASRFDMAAEPLAFAKQRAGIIKGLFAKLEQRTPSAGMTYEDTRLKFNMLLVQYLRTFNVAGKFIGGVTFNRAKRGDPGAPATPLAVVPVARQREALAYLRAGLFSADAFRFSPSLLNKLAVDKDIHWGLNPFQSTMLLSINDRVLTQQQSVLNWLLTPGLLNRLRDNEARVAKPSDTLTTAELFGTLTSAIFSELKPAAGPVAVPALRRDLQRDYVSRLISHYQGVAGAPADAQSLARTNLRRLSNEISAGLRRDPAKIDATTRAHLEQLQERILRALMAQTIAPA